MSQHVALVGEVAFFWGVAEHCMIDRIRGLWVQWGDGLETGDRPERERAG